MKKFNFKFSIFYEDTDSGGYVYHANYLKYAERARTEILKEICPSVIKILSKGDFSFVVRNTKIDFIKPCILFDNLTVKSNITEVKKTSLSINQIILKKSVIHSKVFSQLVWVEKKTGKPSKLTNDLISRLNSFKIV
tara:strand:+ start:161 stop:571 length:411 start_codon:yes stop_codon:yes gene_type:complete